MPWNAASIAIERQRCEFLRIRLEIGLSSLSQWLGSQKDRSPPARMYKGLVRQTGSIETVVVVAVGIG